MPRETQATVNAWQESIYGPLTDTRALLLRCQREMVEAMMAAGIPLEAMVETIIDEHRRQTAKATPPADVGGELTDLQLMLYACARSTGTDLAESVDRLMVDLRQTRFAPAAGTAGRPFQLFRQPGPDLATLRVALAERYGAAHAAAFATWPELGAAGPGWAEHAATRRAVADALVGALAGRVQWDEAERVTGPALAALTERLVERMHAIYAHNPPAIRREVEDRLLRSPAGACAAIAAIARPDPPEPGDGGDPTQRAAAILVAIALGKLDKEAGDRLAETLAAG